jgi:hypothetical protein
MGKKLVKAGLLETAKMAVAKEGARERSGFTVLVAYKYSKTPSAINI